MKLDNVGFVVVDETAGLTKVIPFPARLNAKRSGTAWSHPTAIGTEPCHWDQEWPWIGTVCFWLDHRRCPQTRMTAFRF